MKMKFIKRSVVYAFMVLPFLLGCNQAPEQKEKPQKSDYRKEMMEANRHVVKTEAQHIDDFLKRYKWDVKETGSGLRYWIYKEGEGPRAQKGMVASVEYSVKLITGDEVYSSDRDGLLTFLIGKGEVISGLEEGILLMDVTDEAKFIIPSHLAYGLVGDDNRIPGKATLIYDIKLLEIKQTH